jgi:phosphoglycolate phosphatase
LVIAVLIPPGLESLLPRFIAEMAADGEAVVALAGGERRALAERVHAMRGKCAMFGEDDLAALLAELERRAPTAAAGEIEALVGRVAAKVAELRRSFASATGAR